MEMLLVIGIIAVLAAILFPVFARAREQARSQTCRANLLNIGMALRMYAHEHDGLYPPHDYDMTPLYPKYLALDIVFDCPSDSYGGEDSIRMVPPDWEPPEPEELPAEPPGGAPGMSGMPGMEPGMDPGMDPCMELPAWDEDLLKTSYLYHGGGRRHNAMPLTGLVADSDTRHNERANVLMSDGAIRSVSESEWLELGFGEELPEYLFAQPAWGDGMGMPGMPPGMPPGMEPGMEPGPPPDIPRDIPPGMQPGPPSGGEAPPP